MSKYALQVRGETVLIEFTRINDSRRLKSFMTMKNPNLFGVCEVMICHMDLPSAFAPARWRDRYINSTYPVSGAAFCHWGDKWDSRKGRSIALREAIRKLSDSGAEAPIPEIVAAYYAEQQRRQKVKGPARIAKAPRPPKPYAPLVRESLAKLVEQLQRLITPPTIKFTGGAAGKMKAAISSGVNPIRPLVDAKEE